MIGQNYKPFTLLKAFTSRPLSYIFFLNIFNDVLNILVLYCRRSSVASPICQEGQSERTFPILAFSSRYFLFSQFFLTFSRFFPSSSRFLTIFFAVKGGTLPPCRVPPLSLYWLHHCVDAKNAFTLRLQILNMLLIPFSRILLLR